MPEEEKTEPQAPVRNAAAARTAMSGLSALDAMIAEAPDAPEPLPAPAPLPPAAAQPSPAEQSVASGSPQEPQGMPPALDDSFYQDPLILSALERFEGRMVGQ